MVMIGRTVTPLDFISTTKRLMPLCFGAAGSVRAASQPQSATWAALVHIFCPRMM